MATQIRTDKPLTDCDYHIAIEMELILLPSNCCNPDKKLSTNKLQTTALLPPVGHDTVREGGPINYIPIQPGTSFHIFGWTLSSGGTKFSYPPPPSQKIKIIQEEGQLWIKLKLFPHPGVFPLPNQPTMRLHLVRYHQQSRGPEMVQKL